MIRRRWAALGFYWQVYISVVLAFGGIITLVEGAAEPLALHALERWLGGGAVLAEIILWLISVLLPSLLLGFIITRLVMRRLEQAVSAAGRLAAGDLTARIRGRTPGEIFGRLARSFNGMADSLETLLAHERQLLADISHELRSPLARMSVAAALLPMTRSPEDLAAKAAVLEEETAHMSHLVGLLLEQGRERLRTHDEAEVTDLAEAAGAMTEKFAALAAEGGKSVSAAAAGRPLVRISPAGLRRILENILANAVFYAPAGTAVAVRTAAEDGWAVCTVRDHGPGVPENCLNDILKPFFRADPSRARASGGTGLGLALARDAAAAAGGSITAHNAGPGLCVTVRLPLAEPGAAGPPCS